MSRLSYNNNDNNFVERYNQRNKKIKKLYNDLIRPEVFAILANYGVTTLTGVVAVAMIGVAIAEPDLFPEDFAKEIMASMIIGGGATGIFSLEHFMATKEKRKESYEKIREYQQKKNNIYDFCVCNEEVLSFPETNEIIEENSQSLLRK